MEYILYGAGKRGRKIENMLFKKNISILGFMDSVQTGTISCEGNREYKIYTMEECLNLGKDNIGVVITIADHVEHKKIVDMLEIYKIPIVSVEQVLKTDKDLIVNNRNFIAEYHEIEMDDYFEEAENKDSLDVFWSEDSEFYKLFQQLDTSKIVELACGRGRHVDYYIAYANEVVLVDILEKNIAYCQKRFLGNEKIKHYQNNGYDLSKLDSGSYTAVFSYDAMVHFEMMDIFNYLKETERILVDGGRALFHHSNNSKDYKVTFSTGVHGRNYMSKGLFAHLAHRAGLQVVSQYTIDWGGVKKLDCITLLEKKS